MSRSAGIQSGAESRSIVRALGASQPLLERVFASLSDAVFILDADTVVVLDCSPAALRMFGYSRQEMLGQPTAFLHVDNGALEEFRSHLYSAIEEHGSLSRLMFRMRRKDGTIFPTEHWVVPLEDDQGRRVGWVSVVRDVSERRQRVDDEVQRRVSELAAIHRSSQRLQQLRSPEVMAQEIIRVLEEMLDYEYGAVLLLDESTGRLLPLAVSDQGRGPAFAEQDKAYWASHDLGLEVGIAGWVARTGRSVRVGDVQQDPRYYPVRESSRSKLCVPLRFGDTVLGVVNVETTRADAYTEADQRVLETVAAQMAVAIQNARLYERVQQHARGLEEKVAERTAELVTANERLSQEIVEREEVERELQRVNRALRMLAGCTQSLIRAEEEQELLDEVCRVAVQVGGYRLAWVGYALQDEEKSVRPVAQMGYEEGYLDTVQITWADSERGRGPTGTAIRTGQPAPARDILTDLHFKPWRAEAVKRGYASSLALPLIAGERTLGSLNIYASEPEAFDQAEAELLMELASDLAFGIMALRVRAEHLRAEAEIDRLYQELQERAAGLEKIVARRTRELQAERDLSRSVLETLSEAVVVADLGGTILYANPAAVDLADCEPQEIVGKPQRGVCLSGDQSEEIWSQVQESLRSGQIWRGEVVNRRGDGTLYDAAFTVAPLFDPGDPQRPIGSVWVQRDITLLKEAERVKDHFISNVSHELRTPLSVIMLVVGNLDMLYDRLDEGRRKKMIADIRAQAEVLSHLIGDVLEVSRLDSGRVPAWGQRVNLAQLVREEVDKQMILARRKGQTVSGTGDDELVVSGHDEQLRRVVRNLLNNAIKFTPEGGRIICQWKAGGGGVEWGREWPGSGALSVGLWAGLRVEDSGIGISEAHIPHLFQRFHRVRDQANIPGTGLGLAIVRELVEANGGHVAVTSTVGEGSIFAIYLPSLEEV